MLKCQCCGREKELRLGVCWDCANAESIIADGTDMFGKTIPLTSVLPNRSEELNQVRFLIVKGWTPPNNN